MGFAAASAMHPSAGIVRVGALPLCVFAHLDVRPCALCGDGACRSAPAVHFCAFRCAPARPLRGSCVSERSRCAFLRISMCARAPSAGIVRVGALPLCVFAHFDVRPAPVHPLRESCVSERSRCAFLRILQLASHTLCGDRACRSAPSVRFCVFSSVVVHPLRGSCVSEPSSPLPLLLADARSCLDFL